MPIKWGLVGFNTHRFPGKSLENRLLTKLLFICGAIVIKFHLRNVKMPTLNCLLHLFKTDKNNVYKDNLKIHISALIRYYM